MAWQSWETAPEDRPILVLLTEEYTHPYRAMVVKMDDNGTKWLIYWPENDGIEISAPSFCLWQDIPEIETQ